MAASPTGILFYDGRAKPLSTVGQTQPGAYYQFYLTGTTTPTNVYADGLLQTPLSQTPGTGGTTAAADGRLVAMYMDPTVVYRVQLYNSLGVLLSDIDPYIPDLLPTASQIGQQLYPRTTTEIALGITPSNFSYPADPWIDPRRYGADSTGVADSTAALQTSLNVAQSMQGVIWIGNNCAFKTGALSLTFTNTQAQSAGIRIIGSSPNGSQLIPTGSPATLLTFTNSVRGGTVGGAAITIENLTLNGSGKNTDAILIQDLGNFTIRRVFAFGFNKVVNLNSALTGVIEDCYFLINNWGIFGRQDPSSGSGNNMVKVVASVIGACSQWGIDFGAGDGFKVRDCDMENNGTSTAITFTAPLVSTAGTGTLTSNWALPTGGYSVTFSNGDVRVATMTLGTNAVSWAPGLSSSATINATVVSGAIAIRSTVNFATGEALATLDGNWFEGNKISIMAEASSNLIVSVSNSPFYDGPGVLSVFIDSGNTAALRNILASSTGQSLLVRGLYSDLECVQGSAITDTTTFPSWRNVVTSAGNFPLGRPDSFTGTLTGCATAPTLAVGVLQQGADVQLNFSANLSATSTSTGCSVTGLPAIYQPASIQNFVGLAINNGVSSAIPIQLNPGSGSISLNTTFTASGNKGVPPTIYRYRMTA